MIIFQVPDAQRIYQSGVVFMGEDLMKAMQRSMEYSDSGSRCAPTVNIYDTETGLHIGHIDIHCGNLGKSKVVEGGFKNGL